jgi:hypothetical protein
MNHALLACLLLACAEPPPAGDCDSGRCDDLVDRDLVVAPRVPPRIVDASPASFTVLPTIVERGRTVTVTTDDLRGELDRLIAPGDTLVVRSEDEDITSRFGFLVEVRPRGDVEWETLLPDRDQFHWTELFLAADGGNVTVSGLAVQFTDTFGGSFVPDQAFRDIPERVVPVRSTEFRVLVIPLWDWFDFDDTGYESTVSYFPLL